MKDTTWPRNAIDRFILAELEAENLAPSAPADKAHLLRRLYFDLTGLPPGLGELDAFLADHSEDTVERVVDRLLASPAFGERLAQEWLDVARYGDTDGLFEDHPRRIHPWRDWVVAAFNENLPYSDFITWQLAGDLLPEPSHQQKIATGFLRNNPTSNEGGLIDENHRIKYLIDRINTTSTAFLGLTMECAQCHDHKFDPMTQQEYYQMGGFFNNLVGKGNTKGATAPTLGILAPAQETRLAELAPKIATLEQTLAETPPAMQEDFEAWLVALEQPVDWQAPEVVSPDGPGPDTRQAPPGRPSPVSGRFVRIESAKGHHGFITISEVEVFSGGSNVARAGTARQSSDYGPDSPAGKAIDGTKDGSFPSCSCTRREQQDPWWEIDLGAVRPIDHIVVYNRSDCCPERLDNVRVRVLDENRAAAAVHEIRDAPFRSEWVLNPEAPKPKAAAPKHELVVAPEPGRITALRLSSQEDVTLILYGSAQCRIAHFPWGTR